MSKLYVVGIGPGGYEQMTVKAVKVLEECDIIVGYTVYVDLVAEHFAGKEMLTTPMRQEEKRCRMAFDEVMKGRNTAMICSGDAGVYGMSGLIYEISRDYPGIEIEIVSGVTAALSGGALVSNSIHKLSLILSPENKSPVSWSNTTIEPFVCPGIKIISSSRPPRSKICPFFNGSKCLVCCCSQAFSSKSSGHTGGRPAADRSLLNFSTINVFCVASYQR